MPVMTSVEPDSEERTKNEQADDGENAAADKQRLPQCVAAGKEDRDEADKQKRHTDRKATR